MMNRINLICLGVKDLDKACEFYKKLGFQTTAKKGAVIVFFNNQGTKLELFPISNLALDINKTNPPKYKEDLFSGITLACNMKSESEVDSIFKLVEAIGGSVVKMPEKTSWGGYSGYFKDLDGYYLEFAYCNSWQFDANDMLIIE